MKRETKKNDIKYQAPSTRKLDIVIESSFMACSGKEVQSPNGDITIINQKGYGSDETCAPTNWDNDLIINW